MKKYDPATASVELFIGREVMQWEIERLGSRRIA